MPRLSRLILATMLLLPLQVLAQGDNPPQPTAGLKLDISGLLDGSCDTSRSEVDRPLLYYADGMYDIVVRLLPDNKRPGEVEYQGVTDWTWPAGLVISVAQAASAAESFQPSAALRDRLGLKYYVIERQASADSLWRATGHVPHPALRAPEYRFAFHMPPDLADSYLCIQVAWQHPQYGLLQTGAPCIRIIEPCSEAARHAMWCTQVNAAFNQGDFAQACARADSFVTLGWRDVWGLNFAMNAAMHLMRYDDAIRFIDLLLRGQPYTRSHAAASTRCATR